MNTQTEPLKSEFGTAPHEVIRERYARFEHNGYPNLSLMVDPTDERIFSPDDLITVLDALKDAAGTIALMPAERDTQATKAAKARKLRIEILASLGIDESDAA